MEAAIRWRGLDKLLARESALAPPGFEACVEVREFLQNTFKILCIGAGGLGCEILKDLALSGFGNIHVIDMDTIDLSNLNRQFLFRKDDIGKPKAEVAAAFINKRISGVTVTPHVGKIQDKDIEFYRSFNVVVAGLDSVEARRWINSTLASLVEVNGDGTADLSTMIPLIDGGTEGFKGQARVILPRYTPCFECTINTFPKQTRFAICTLANTPRQPEHCVEWAMLLHWPQERPGEKIDGDDPEHVTWIFNEATKRAAQFSIKGVTYMLSQGVIKNIIPAIASTNAVIAGMCSLEAWKIATSCAPFLNNYLFYNGGESVYSHSFEYERAEDCPVCGTVPKQWTMKSSDTLQDLIDRLADDGSFQLSRPSIGCGGKKLYMAWPPQLEKLTQGNLTKTLPDLFPSGSELGITDPALASTSLTLVIDYDEAMKE